MKHNERAKLHCNQCRKITNHVVLHCEITETDDGDEHVTSDGEVIYNVTIYGEEASIIKCLGCDYVHFYLKSWAEGDEDEKGQKYNITYYPPIEVRRSPAWYTHFVLGLPKHVRELLHEIYVSLQNDALRLCALGIRALLEQLMIDRAGEHGSIGKNITAFFNAGYVAAKQQDIYREKLIEIGNAAMHRGYKPHIRDLIVILDITESILAAIYIHPRAASGVGSDIPPRQKP